MPEMKKKYTALLELLKAYAPFHLAFSGGVDSRFLAHAARQAKAAFTAVHIAGPHVPRLDTEAALAWLERRGIAAVVVQFDPLVLDEVRRGTKNRCYQCKLEIFRLIRARAGLQPVAEGSNASDKMKFRPGARALQELGILSPLAEVGLGKPEIRSLAGHIGLEQPDQPSRPCLLTRFDYGLSPDKELLQRLASAENAIATLGFKNFRMRIFRDEAPILQIDWQESRKLEEVRSKLEQLLAGYGFPEAKIHTEFEISGFFDRKGHEQQLDGLAMLKDLF